MPGQPDLRMALETRLKAIATPLSTAWENALFTPVANTPYQQVNLVLAAPINPEMGRLYQENGYMQVTLRYPLNTGAGAAQTRAQAIRDWLYRGLSVAANGLTVTINRTPAIGASFVDGDRFCIPVKISFFANVAA